MMKQDMETEDRPQVSPEGFCGRFDRCSSSLIEEPEYCEVCRYYRDRDSRCLWPEPAQD
jgi:hypothetical protein